MTDRVRQIGRDRWVKTFGEKERQRDNGERKRTRERTRKIKRVGEREGEKIFGRETRI